MRISSAFILLKCDCFVLYCRNLLVGDESFCVPAVVWNLTTKHILTTDLVDGETLDRMDNSDQQTRNLVQLFLLPTSVEYLHIIGMLGSHSMFVCNCVYLYAYEAQLVLISLCICVT